MSASNEGHWNTYFIVEKCNNNTSDVVCETPDTIRYFLEQLTIETSYVANIIDVNSWDKTGQQLNPFRAKFHDPVSYSVKNYKMV